MQLRFLRFLSLLCLGAAALLLAGIQTAQANPLRQIPTVAIPTVTGTPSGAYVRVLMDQETVNVRSGPSTYDYPVIGVLIAGQEVPALGRSPGGEWIQIAYPGAEGNVAWVYAFNVEPFGSLPVIEPPPTPTPQTTPTIDPTLAAQFVVEAPPTRLPTYTPPPPLVIPTFPPEASSPIPGRLPIGLIIIGMGVVGLFGMVISLLGGRRG
jgi:hypothetical protein